MTGFQFRIVQTPDGKFAYQFQLGGKTKADINAVVGFATALTALQAAIAAQIPAGESVQMFSGTLTTDV